MFGIIESYMFDYGFLRGYFLGIVGKSLKEVSSEHGTGSRKTSKTKTSRSQSLDTKDSINTERPDGSKTNSSGDYNSSSSLGELASEAVEKA